MKIIRILSLFLFSISAFGGANVDTFFYEFRNTDSSMFSGAMDQNDFNKIISDRKMAINRAANECKKVNDSASCSRARSVQSARVDKAMAIARPEFQKRIAKVAEASKKPKAQAPTSSAPAKAETKAPAPTISAADRDKAKLKASNDNIRASCNGAGDQVVESNGVLECVEGENEALKIVKNSSEPGFEEKTAKDVTKCTQENKKAKGFNKAQESCKQDKIEEIAKTDSAGFKEAMTGDDQNTENVKALNSKLDNAITRRISPALENIDCMRFITEEVESLEGTTDEVPRVLSKTFYTNIVRSPKRPLNEMLTTVQECASSVLGNSFINDKPMKIRNEELFCKRLLTLMAREYFEANGSDIVSKNSTGQVTCTKLKQSQIGAAEQARASSNTKEFISAQKRCRNELVDASDETIRDCAKTAIVQPGAVATNGAVHSNCTESIEKIRELLGSSEESGYLKEYVHDKFRGCISMNALDEVVKASDSDLEGGFETYQAIDFQTSGLECISRGDAQGPYAIDYKGCVTAINWYNSFAISNDIIAPVVGNAVGAINEIDNQAATQRDLANATNQVDGTTAALRSQQRIFRKRAQLQTAKAGIETARAMAMFGNIMAFPTPKLISEEWTDGNNEIGLEGDFATVVIEMHQENGDYITQTLFPNQNVKMILVKTGAVALSKAVVAAIVAKTLRKQARLVGKVEKALTEADFAQPGAGFDFGPGFCDQNPTSPSCGGVSRGNRVSTGGVEFGFSGIGAGGNGNLGFDKADVNAGINSANAVKGDGGAQETLGSILGANSDGKFDKRNFNKVAAAKSGSGSDGGGGGGGGGTGGGGGGATSGGGGDGPARGPAGRRGPGSSKIKKAKFISGSGGKMFSGKNSRKQRKSRNPFANLGRGRKPSGGLTINEDKNLLPKTSKLFETISRRYAAVNKDNRLKKN